VDAAQRESPPTRAKGTKKGRARQLRGDGTRLRQGRQLCDRIPLCECHRETQSVPRHLGKPPAACFRIRRTFRERSIRSAAASNHTEECRAPNSSSAITDSSRDIAMRVSPTVGIAIHPQSAPRDFG
jgi:hypothetical protein